LRSRPSIKYVLPLPSSLEAPRRHTPRRWETPERHRGGRTDYRRGAANLPISTPPRGTGTSPRSSPSATLIPSPSILEIAIPGHHFIWLLVWADRGSKISLQE
ncbi:unnamed protein product, partial [Musa acuminata subsp. burmannicoides]